MTILKQIVDSIATSHELTKTASDAIVRDVFNAISQSLVSGEEVSIPGFGKFLKRVSPQKNGRNPSTGDVIIIPEKNKVVFKPSSVLKTTIN